VDEPDHGFVKSAIKTIEFF